MVEIKHRVHLATGCCIQREDSQTHAWYRRYGTAGTLQHDTLMNQWIEQKDIHTHISNSMKCGHTVCIMYQVDVS